MSPAVSRGKFFSWSLAQYVGREVLFTFFSGTSIFLVIMLMLQAIRLADFVVVYQVPLSDIGKLSLYLGMSFLPVAIPLAFLFAVLMGFSRGNSEGEILGLQVNGISLPQIYYPVGAFSVVVAVVCLYLSFYSVPRGNRNFELLLNKLGSEKMMVALKPGVFIDGFFGLVLFAEHIVPIKNEMKRVFIYDERDEAHPLVITAQAGLLKTNPERAVRTLRLTDGTIYFEKKQPDGLEQKLNFNVYDLNLEMAPSGSGWRSYTPPSYTFDELKTRIQETAHNPPYHRQLLVEYHRRFSMAFACFVFGALGFLIGIYSQRGVRSTAILVCILIAVVYWLSFLAANALASAGWVAPWVGVWLPNAVFLAGTIYFYRKRARA